MRCCLLVILSVVVGAKSAPVTDDKAHPYPPTYKGPVIGILTQKTNGKKERLGHSYIAASYVKYLEMAGAQVIPVMDSMSPEDMNRTLHSINGILIPGGAQIFPDSKFYQASKYIYDWTVSYNKNGSHFPLWGTCLGFEAILYAEADANVTTDIRFRCSAHMPNNLTLQDGAQDSRMLQNLDSKMYQAIQTEELIYNAHSYCVSTDKIEDSDGSLHDNFNLLAVNWDAHGDQYIALVEHKKLPIYASQFHPEKNAFEWTTYANIPHSRNAILFMQYLGNFFVDEALKNKHQFSESVEFYKRSINNYKPVYTLMAINSTLESCYFFNDRRDDLYLNTTD